MTEDKHEVAQTCIGTWTFVSKEALLRPRIILRLHYTSFPPQPFLPLKSMPTFVFIIYFSS